MTSPDPGPLLLALLVSVVAAVLAMQLALRRRWTELAPRGFLRSRLYRMLAVRGIVPMAYLRVTSASSQKLHLQLCDGCASLSRCDSVIRGGSAEDYDFCPNGPPLDRIQISAAAIGRPGRSAFNESSIQPRSRHRRNRI